MSGAARFLLGALLGVGLGYAVVLLLRPAPAKTHRHPAPPRPARKLEESREEQPVG